MNLPRRMFCAFLAACALASTAPLSAQGAGGRDSANSWVDPNFARLEAAAADLRVEFSAERLVYDKTGDFGVVEEILREGAPGRRFAARLVEVKGAAQLPPHEVTARARKYDAHAGFLQQYQSFRVSDARLATQNYTFVPIWGGTTLGRACHWAAVLPLHHDRSSWLLLIDDETGFPLYQAEYNADSRLASEYRVIAFRPNALARIPATTTWWKPTSYAPQDYPTALDAKQAFVLGTSAKPPLSALSEDLPLGYELALSRITTLLLNGDRSLVFDYSDGVDHLFLSERVTQNQPPPASVGHQIFLYSDLSTTQCKFEHDGIEYLAIGRGNRTSVSNLAKGVYARAVAR